jgi:hypothetical protein
MLLARGIMAPAVVLEPDVWGRRPPLSICSLPPTQDRTFQPAERRQDPAMED